MIQGNSENFKVSWIQSKQSKDAGSVDVGIVSSVYKTEGRKGSLYVW